MRRFSRIALALAGTLVAGVVFASTAAAQGAPLVPRYRFGINAGANVADMTETESADARTGLLIGGQVTIRITEQFAFQPELYYSQKGIKSDIDAGEVGSVEMKMKNDYLEVPLLARYTFTQSPKVHPFLLAGPSLGFSTSCKFEADGESIDCDDDVDLNTFDLGGIAGAGLEFPVGRNAISIGARYDFGFNEVIKDSDSKNRTISFLVGFVF